MATDPPNRSLSSAFALVAATCLTFLAGCSGSNSSDSGNKAPDADNDKVADSADCAPQDPKAWQTLTFASRDEDGDVFRVNVGGTICAGRALPSNRLAALATATELDCDDTSVARWANRHYEAVDADLDGHLAAVSGDVCTGTALPPPYFATMPAGAESDCDESDATRWRLLSFASRDLDGDGYRANVAGTQCGQPTLPANLYSQATEAIFADCDDTNNAHWRWMATYHDFDGDGTGSGPALRQCMGRSAPDGYVLTGYDPLDDPANPSSAAVSDFDLPGYLLVVAEDGDDDIF